MSIWKIYKLSDPRTGEVRYVGITSIGLQERLQWHMKGIGRDRNYAKSRWLTELATTGLVPDIQQLDCASSRKKAEQRERLWIWAYLARGHNLTNIVHVPSGGFGEWLTSMTLAQFLAILAPKC